ncbi:MAG: hypothetical protein H7A35_12140 [Planctomycetales bacterium]|nr:hypothetical protein [bacterium]UNM07605.1 MAG: hypothetical protein H7A35_12140 [Planctomycetales bacterium]
MPASTPFSRFTAIFVLLVLLAPAGPVQAAEQVLVQRANHPVWQLGEGLSAILCAQLEASGLFDASLAIPAEALEDFPVKAARRSASSRLLSEQIAQRYIVELDVLYFDVGIRDNTIDLGDDFNDLSRMFGGSDSLAECRLHIRMSNAASGAVIVEGDYSGRESRRGVRLNHLSWPVLRQMDYLGADFHESNLGLATYKAIGAFLYDLYQRIPFQGRVLALSGDTAVVSLGGSQLVQVGDELSVLRIESITDMSGRGVWDEPLKLATLRVLELREDRCLCLVLDGSLQLREGDAVRPTSIRWTLPDEADHATPAELYY